MALVMRLRCTLDPGRVDVRFLPGHLAMVDTEDRVARRLRRRRTDRRRTGRVHPHWVDPAFEGQGVGSALVRHALDQILAGGTRKVVPVCPFVKRYIRRHPEYLPVAYRPKRSHAD